ncbi:hypothetical protein AMTRI_Chr01g114760 [Amborella trichopoda]
MPEKGLSPSLSRPVPLLSRSTSLVPILSRSSSFIPRSLSSLIVVLFLVVVIVWAADSSSIDDAVMVWKNRWNYSIGAPFKTHRNLTHSATTKPESLRNLTQMAVSPSSEPQDPVSPIDSAVTDDRNMTFLATSSVEEGWNVTLPMTMSAEDAWNLTFPEIAPGEDGRNLTFPVISSSEDSPNITLSESVISISKASSEAQQEDFAALDGRNLTHNEFLPLSDGRNLTLPASVLAKKAEENGVFEWISFPEENNVTARFLESMSGATAPAFCRDTKTESVTVSGLEVAGKLRLTAGKIHTFAVSAYDIAGKPRCSGGDYFETDLSGASWKSRPPLQDNGNGSYTLSLQVHPDFAGDHVLSIVLLFRNYQGMKRFPERWAVRKEVFNKTLRFENNGFRNNGPEALKTCGKEDFRRGLWSGRWTRLARSEPCEIDASGRFRCLRPSHPCRKPWCSGPLGSLESNGWVYSAHCSFRLYNAKDAWKCLRNRWIFFWGDSNHVDTLRNLLNFVLNRPDVASVARRFDLNFTNPDKPSETVRITSIFNGHHNETLNYLGLDSLHNENFRNLLRSYFTGESVPDAMVMNSGLHDGVNYRNPKAFAEAATMAAAFWAEVLVGRHVEVFYRTTVAAGGHARALSFNPHKMEVYNWMALEKLRERGVVNGVVDGFDMTYPWHYDNRCSDGVHYGRAPARARWRDGLVGHQYFVDLMLAHVLLDALCAKN